MKICNFNKLWALILCGWLIPHLAFCQMEFKDIIKKINWPCTEQELVQKLGQNITPAKQEVWEFENTESNYRFNNVSVMGLPITNSFIRVNRDNKVLFRLNFNVLIDETDHTIYPQIDKYLEKLYGAPTIRIEDNAEKKHIWAFEKYCIISSFMDISNVLTTEIEKYLYSIKVEPLRTFYVDWTKAIVESNNARIPITQIEYFRTDNDDNVYIKEVGKNEIVKEKNKCIPTPKGNVITFEDGMFCFRATDNDIVYIKSGFAVTYPLINNVNSSNSR